MLRIARNNTHIETYRPGTDIKGVRKKRKEISLLPDAKKYKE